MVKTDYSYFCAVSLGAGLSPAFAVISLVELELQPKKSFLERLFNRRSGQNGPQNGPKKGHFQRNTLEGSVGPSVSVDTSKLS
jgi:hypothetical protein